MVRAPLSPLRPLRSRGVEHGLEAPAGEAVELRVPLRLSVAGGGLGLELYEPISLGPVHVASLLIALPNLRFPVDLSGGVRTFRHRRGRLEHLRVEAEVGALVAHCQRRLEATLGGLVRPPELWGVEQGVGIGLVGASGAVAFELLWAPLGADLRWVVAAPRALGPRTAPLALVLPIVDTLLGDLGERRGRVVTIRQLGAAVTRGVLPALGARVPSMGDLHWSGLEVSDERLAFELGSGLVPAEPSVGALRALELATLTSDADDALVAGEVDRAREAYLVALERAPRHPEIARAVAALDLYVGHRPEAALSLLVDAVPAVHAGVEGAELLAAVGDLPAARQAVDGSVAGERFSPFAALALERLSELEIEPSRRLAALDRAVALCPGLSGPRWARTHQRLVRGDVGGALADAQHLEAIAKGVAGRHAVCRRAARAVLDAGFVRDAGALFERALRYLPDDPVATAGLARALAEAGRGKRAAALLQRTLALLDARGFHLGALAGEALFDLAKVLAGQLGDLPQAIARVREVPATCGLALDARGLEARWRAALGDQVGASQAYARMREHVLVSTQIDPRAGSEWLVEAASFERSVFDDLRAAEAHLAVALRLAPGDGELATRYRQVAAQLGSRERLARGTGPPAPADPAPSGPTNAR